ncbi:MAG: hypothetical protein LBK58_09360 [Prevotellaceae bacterium]|jgi:hypothetical protein|nr:hypothetical protein [Prevotellaceae bacterium]
MDKTGYDTGLIFTHLQVVGFLPYTHVQNGEISKIPMKNSMSSPDYQSELWIPDMPFNLSLRIKTKFFFANCIKILHTGRTAAYAVESLRASADAVGKAQHPEDGR